MIYQRWELVDKYYREQPDIRKPVQINFKSNPMVEWETPKEVITCQCCKTSRKFYAFPEVPDSTFGYTQKNLTDGRTLTHSRAIYCIFCLNEIGEKFSKDPGMDKYKALYRICAFTNLYYDDRVAHLVIDDKAPVYVDGTPVDPRISWVDRYFRAIKNDPVLSGKNFYTSDNFIYEAVVEHQCDPEELEQRKLEEYNRLTGGISSQKKESKEAFEKKYLSEAALENRAQILRMFHYDPFENESITDKEGMYIDLTTMLDDAMADDLVRQKAAIEIVRSFKHIEKLSDAIRELQENTESIVANEKQLKSLVDQKKKETDLVTQFSKDHGFAEKYAISKSKGSGTLSAIVRDMIAEDYDRGAINKFDIETAAAIKQVSDISAESIFKQVQFSDSEYASMLKEQAEAIRGLTAERNKLKEELRIIKEKRLKQELMNELEKELKRKKISREDIDEILKREVEAT